MNWTKSADQTHHLMQKGMQVFQALCFCLLNLLLRCEWQNAIDDVDRYMQLRHC